MVAAKEELVIRMRAEDAFSREVRKAGKESERFGRTSERAFRRSGKAADRAFRQVRNLAGGYLTITAAIRSVRAAAAKGLGLVEASSGFEETLAKASQVFGDSLEGSATELDLFADAAGRGRSELLDTAASFQAYLVALGVAREEAAGLSVDLTTLTTDLSSFNNVAEQEVAQRLFSGLAGEIEAVRRFGVDLGAARVEQEALRRGLADTTEELTQQDKVLTRIALIYEATTLAQGDAIRTADSYQNQMRRLQGGISDLAVVLGEDLQKHILATIEEMGGLDKVLELVEVGMGTVLGVSKKVVTVAGDMAKGVNALIEELGGADRIASALAGDLLSLAGAGKIAEATLARAGRGIGEVFEGIEESFAVMLSNIAARARAEIPAIFVGLMIDLQNAAAGTTVGRALGFDEIPESARDAAVRILGFVEPELQGYADIWKQTGDDVLLEFKGWSDDMKAILRELSAEGLDLDLDLGARARAAREEAAAVASTVDPIREAARAAQEQAAALSLGESMIRDQRDALRETLDPFGARLVAIQREEAALRAEIATLAEQGELLERDASTLTQILDDHFAAQVRLLEIERERLETARKFAEAIAGQDFGAGFGAGVERQFRERTLGRAGADAARGVFDAADNGMEGFINALIQGENALDAFVQGLLQTIQQIATQIAVQTATNAIVGGLGVGGARGGYVHGFARGGVASYAGGGSVDPRDTIPAMLRPGEFVVRPEAVARPGVRAELQRINSGASPTSGGVVFSPSIAVQGGGLTEGDVLAVLNDNLRNLENALVERARRNRNQRFATAFKSTGRRVN